MSVNIPHQSEFTKDVEGFHPRLSEISQKFLDDLMEEKQRLGEEFPLCALLIDEAIERIYSNGRLPGKEVYADVFKQKPLKVTQKVFVPVKQYPKFNFTGKILGPKGNCLRRLHDETQCKITLKGRNSTRNCVKEEELRNSGDPKYAHYNKDLYVEISTIAPPAESYARIAYALAEIRKYIIPDKNDEVSQEQMREMMEINPDSMKALGAKSHAYKQEPDEEIYEYSRPYVMKRQPVYEYTRVRPYVSTQKRPQQSTVYGPEIKRLREASSTLYKPSSYDILKKYQ